MKGKSRTPRTATRFRRGTGYGRDLGPVVPGNRGISLGPLPPVGWEKMLHSTRNHDLKARLIAMGTNQDVGARKRERVNVIETKVRQEAD